MSSEGSSPGVMRPGRRSLSCSGGPLIPFTAWPPLSYTGLVSATAQSPLPKKNGPIQASCSLCPGSSQPPPTRHRDLSPHQPQHPGRGFGFHNVCGGGAGPVGPAGDGRPQDPSIPHPSPTEPNAQLRNLTGLPGDLQPGRGSGARRHPLASSWRCPQAGEEMPQSSA